MKKTVFLLSSFIIMASFLGLNAQKVRFFKLGSHVMNLQQAQELIALSDPQLIALFQQPHIQRDSQPVKLHPRAGRQPIKDKTKNVVKRSWRV